MILHIIKVRYVYTFDKRGCWKVKCVEKSGEGEYCMFWSIEIFRDGRNSGMLTVQWWRMLEVHDVNWKFPWKPVIENVGKSAGFILPVITDVLQ